MAAANPSHDDIGTDEETAIQIAILANFIDRRGNLLESDLGRPFTQTAQTVARNTSDPVADRVVSDARESEFPPDALPVATRDPSEALVAFTSGIINKAVVDEADISRFGIGKSIQNTAPAEAVLKNPNVRHGVPDPTLMQTPGADDRSRQNIPFADEGLWVVGPVMASTPLQPAAASTGVAAQTVNTVAAPEAQVLTLAAFDVANIDPPEFNLFDPNATVSASVENDSTAVELGVRFSAIEDGRITALKYYRSLPDSGDTDIRDGRLWDATGNLLATVTFVSDPGASGWQVAALATPVQILANVAYTVSYRTLDYYVATSNFFTNGHSGPSGELIAAAGANGVYAYGSGVSLPTQSYQSSNYWVDVSFVATPVVNTPPVFTSSPAVSVAENKLVAATLTASDGEFDALTFAIAAGADAGLFTIDANSGILRFVSAPDFEAPVDANGDNIYEVTVSVSDGTAPTVTQAILVSVLDVVNENGQLYSSVFAASDQPGQTKTNDPTDYELGMKFIAGSNGEIHNLRYYRGAADATDTDSRVLNLWSGNGQILGSVTVVSAPGDVGWQTGILSAPVTVQANTTYVVSYGTIQNYSFDLNYFNAAVTGADGLLTAPSVGQSGGNGVYSGAGPGNFPTQTYLGSNYWVDVDFLQAGLGPNNAPVADADFGFVPVNGSVLIDVVDGDIDLEEGTPDPTTVQIVNGDDPAGKIKTVQGEGVWVVDPATGGITFTPETDYSGPVTAITYTIADSQGLASAPAPVSVTITPPPPIANGIVAENQKPGVPDTVWDAEGSNQIEGFATDISYDNGDLVSFKINLNTNNPNGVPYHIEIYRIGYYGGAGATLVTTLTNLTGISQPDPITDDRGLVDAGNWSVSATWQSPDAAASGVYLAKLVRDDNGATNQIPFILREDETRSDGSKSDIVFQTSDTTWQAYNGWGGNNAQVAGNFYGGYDQPDGLSSDPGLNPDRAFAVSYNRPILTRDFGGAAAGPQDYLFGAEFAAIYWLEQNGYDVSYISGVDTDRLGAAALLGHKAYLSVGHDEYWSGDQRANVEAARDAGVNLLFWSGNEVYWKTRYEPSIDGSATGYRTLVSYKETWNNLSSTAGPADYADLDPSDQWTGTWRDLRFVDAVDAQGNPTALGARPENSLTGQLFLGDGNTSGAALDIPTEFSGLRVWRNTAAANGGVLNVAEGILGYELNVSPNDQYRPAGLIKLSSTAIDWPAILTDQGNTDAPGTLTHNLSLYRAPSGALVFGAGTVFWTWGLSDKHDSYPYGGNLANPTLQQFTVNMFADMGIQPAVGDAILASQGLVRAFASTDVTPATITMNTLPASVAAFQPVVISGTATDNDGNAATTDGVVAGIEVSVDGGQNWYLANGTTNWSYAWVPAVTGTYQVQVRALDDSLNLPSGTGIVTATVDVTPPDSAAVVSLLETGTAYNGVLQNDNAAVELGMRFSTAEDGQIAALKYYRTTVDATDTDVREGRLWDAQGNLLATVTFTSTAGQTGWQTAVLNTPVHITADTEYVVSYRTNDYYSATSNFFGAGYSDPFGTLSAAAGSNGVYAYGNSIVFPTQSYFSSNYWVDVGFQADSVPSSLSTAPVMSALATKSVPLAPSAFASSDHFVISPDQVSVGRVLAIDPEGDPLTYQIVGGKQANRFYLDEDGFLFYDAPGNGNGAGGVNPVKGKTFTIVVNASDGDDFSANQVLRIQVANIRQPVEPGGGSSNPPGWLDPGPPEHVKPNPPGWSHAGKPVHDPGPPDWLINAQENPSILHGNADVFDF